ncbi:MAG: dihydrodipicolinate synthase family protein [Pseudomonadota bacterium]
MKSVYCGVIAPMITPLTADGRVDERGVRRIVRGLVDKRCAPFVCSTTGEAACLSDPEKAELVRIAVDETGGEQIVYAGIADNCLTQSLEKAERYRALGAGAAVAHLPCYYPIDDIQMETYFETLADGCPLPLLLYNIPVTTGLSVSIELLDKLSRHENIVGVKDSERGEERLQKCLELWREREDFTFHLGWAAMSSFGLLNGLDGIVPSSANMVPGLYRDLYDAAKRNDAEEAGRLQAVTDEISAYYQKDLSLSRSIPKFKAMLAACGLCEAFAAPPMRTLSSEEQARIASEVNDRFARYVA